MTKKEHRQFLRKKCKNVKAIHGELQHAVVVEDIDKKKIRNVPRKTCTERRKISMLKDVKIRKQFEGKDIKLVDVGSQNFWAHFKHGVLKACDEVCGKKRGRRNKGDTWWWNDEVKETVLRKKEAHRAMCQNRTGENKMMCKIMKNSK